MGMQSGTIDDVPLALLFPGAGADQLEHVRRVAAAVDALRPPGDPPTWEWWPEHAVSPEPIAGVTPLVLVTAVGLYNEGLNADWLDLELDVVWVRPGVLAVIAAVSVACWCDIDHATHYLEEAVVELVPGVDLGEAMELAAGRMPRWLGCPHDPEYWRAQGLLPARPKSVGPLPGVPAEPVGSVEGAAE
ncbi:hypothetical protein [Yinghuangia seranimata]|uniref:hypothetical protein n=1 Tax=Yinghuangia seranimata TaxID=408067 RepID=UPI00248B0BDC|nr:hypothetical protein [Yinghuangia seranimata]MDI2131246.1 hypothetical protein [Yinghuangia seranimata]